VLIKGKKRIVRTINKFWGQNSHFEAIVEYVGGVYRSQMDICHVTGYLGIVNGVSIWMSKVISSSNEHEMRLPQPTHVIQ